LLNMAMADAAIAAWDTKYTYIGIHTWSAIKQGWKLGGNVAGYVMDQVLHDRPGASQRGH